MSSEHIISAWHHNHASNWTLQQVGEWLQSFVDYDVVQTLLRNSSLTGELLPTVLLSEEERNISYGLSVEQLKLLQRRYIELLFFGPPPILTVSLLSATVVALFATLSLAACLVTKVYASSRAQRCTYMLQLHLLTDYFNDIHMRLVAFTPLSPDSTADCPPSCQSDDRRLSSVSHANRSAVSLMQQLVCISLRAEYNSLLGTVEEVKPRLNAIGIMVRDSRSWVPFSRNLFHLENSIQELSTLLDRLVERLEDLIRRQDCIHEVMDILQTLNDCQSRVELSYRENADFDESGEGWNSVLESTRLGTFNLSPCPSLQTEPLSTTHESCKSKAVSVANGVDPPSLEAEEGASLPSDENSLQGLQGVTAEEAYPDPTVSEQTKIPKLRCSRDVALSPSFFLMNPPSTRIKQPTTLSTPSNIPIGQLKSPFKSSLGKISVPRFKSVLAAPHATKFVNHP